MTKNYDYADDYADDVLNVSGAPWPGSQRVSRPRTITAPPPGQHVSPRTQRMINAQSGEKLDADLAGAAARAARRAALAKMIDETPAGRETLRHLFGLNLPGR